MSNQVIEQADSAEWTLDIKQGENVIFELDSNDMVLLTHEQRTVKIVNDSLEKAKKFISGIPANPINSMCIPATE